jgi:hypothetical protein
MNKSQLSRDFWRRIFDDNKVDLRNADQRNAAVNSFLADPENKKAGWKQADKRFFRLSLDKIFRERGISSHTKGVKPIPQQSQKTTGGFKMNIKTDEKKSHAAPQDNEIEGTGLTYHFTLDLIKSAAKDSIKENPEEFENLVNWFVNASMFLLSDIQDLDEIDLQLRNAI